ncbi:hypothetical protein [Chamaesiphon sp. OTE_20_metabat_361]|uniref:hypothetical protein n=1 Tax=Chamaesiphon sp. OTE_20_metabat_361 TaxID=2964689 RepID=UPI00286A6153|nr:hypothetical protein [Chamaesiphon sp. OTE_20_metabat_361]
MNAKSLVKIGWCGLLSIYLYPTQVSAQVATKTPKNNPATYEDDRIKVTIQNCSRKLQDLVCKATLTSKNNDRTIDLNGNNIKLVDFEGNEYYPSSLRLANRVSENNSIKAELVENVPFKASFIFNKIPTNITQVALLQVSLSGGINATAKFRNFEVNSAQNTATNPIKKPSGTPGLATIVTDVSNDPSSICPDRTKIMYHATSKSYLMYICGAKIPTHYVGISRDGFQGITLRLRYYDRTQFSADNGETNYTIAANRLVIRKDSKIVHQEKIQVVQALPSINAPDRTANKSKPKKTPNPPSSDASQKRI